MPSLRKTWILPFAILAISTLWFALTLAKDLPMAGSTSQIPITTDPQKNHQTQDLQHSKNNASETDSTFAASRLFGIPVLLTNPSEGLPETELELELRGTFASNRNASASALVAEQNSDSRRYFIGDSLPGGAELVKVEQELIVIRRNFQDEVLRLPRFGDIQVGPELAYPDRQVFLERANQGPDENLEATGFELEKNINTNAPEENSNKTSLQDRLAALRERYSNQE